MWPGLFFWGWLFYAAAWNDGVDERKWPGLFFWGWLFYPQDRLVVPPAPRRGRGFSSGDGCSTGRHAGLAQRLPAVAGAFLLGMVVLRRRCAWSPVSFGGRGFSSGDGCSTWSRKGREAPAIARGRGFSSGDGCSTIDELQHARQPPVAGAFLLGMVVLLAVNAWPSVKGAVAGAFLLGMVVLLPALKCVAAQALASLNALAAQSRDLCLVFHPHFLAVKERKALPER